MPLVEKSLDKRQIKYRKQGFDWNSTDWIKFSKKVSADNRDYQREAITTFIRLGCGVVKVPTRGGKTYIAAETIRLLLGSERVKSAFFLVDSVDLFKQSIDEIANYLEVDPSTIGQIREKKFDIQPITVATIQTVHQILYGKENILSKEKRLKKSKLEKHLKSVELPIVDEIHEYGGSKVRMRILRKFTSYRWFLTISATPHKLGKIQQINIDSLTGGVIYEIPEADLVERKVLADNRILLLLFKHDLSRLGDETSYGQVNTHLIINNHRRNLIIAYFLECCKELGLKAIAMFNSKIHGNKLSSFADLTFISGDSSDKLRATIKSEFLSKSGGVLLVSDIWKKGITLPSVEILINADGGKEPSLVIQRRGRILGVTETKKKALYVDFIDDCELYLGEHSISRVEAYEEKLSENKIDVLDTNATNFYRDLKEYMIDFFELNIQE
jgi:superfamily II DNA or RNA helicase